LAAVCPAWAGSLVSRVADDEVALKVKELVDGMEDASAKLSAYPTLDGKVPDNV
jgi:hypothetical protein